MPCPPPGDFPVPGIEPRSVLSPAPACGFFTTEPPGKPQGTSHPEGSVLTELFTEVRTEVQGPWLWRQPGSQEPRSCPTCCGSEPHHAPERARSGWDTGEVVGEQLPLVPGGGGGPGNWLGGREGENNGQPLSIALGSTETGPSAPVPPLLLRQKCPHQAARACSVIQLQPLVCRGFPGDASGKDPACQGRRHGLQPSVGKISWRREWQPTAVFLLGESPWTEEPGWPQRIGSQRVRHDSSQLSMHTQVNTLSTVKQENGSKELNSEASPELLN